MKLFATAALALITATGGALATDLPGVKDATLKFYDGNKNSAYICTTQIVEAEKEIYALTAYHCLGTNLKNNFAVEVTNLNDEGKLTSQHRYVLDIVSKNAKTDIALLKFREDDVDLPTVDVATVEEAEEALVVGARTIAAGYPGTMYSEDFTLTEGLYAGLVQPLVTENDYPFYRTSSVITPGNSGGGLYVEIDDEWKLVGISSQRDPQLPGTANYFSPIENIVAAIDKAVEEAEKEEKKAKDAKDKSTVVDRPGH